MTRKLVFFAGGAGAGKTTLAKALAGKRGMALFDMDTLLQPAAKAIMTAAGLDPYDRDSAEYKKLCRDLCYRITMDAALENVDLGTDTVVIGPFTKELNDPQWIEQELASIGASLQDVDVKVVIVYLPDQESYRGRISQRGLKLDEWKLEHWSEFSRSLERRELAWNLPESSVLQFDNSEPFSESAIVRLEGFIDGEG
ncbi:AAA family ATPase [Paenibacillus sp. NPDC058174]|uniref:AAA family ATPase n=1 Tax=Paenibacillus sp. NPDC058174 TaxID=3346366 RepID=UPI0036DCAD55